MKPPLVHFCLSPPLPCLRAWVLGYSGSSHVEVLCESGAYYSGHVGEGRKSIPLPPRDS
ncbi:Hypothetical protein FKW44_006955 [Caligus rogercresseyi]|uniref:Uncharacterized protein n=1 Tax=Caligus rogercresseyi TaxID=217165 RepID=A0A7T8QT65_CALRO|nr:Hypothetical protein FKW44_006955 [Caligus rogercresseyi]